MVTERLIADSLINRLYARSREDSSLLFKAATSLRMSAVLGFLNFDLPLPGRQQTIRNRIRAMASTSTNAWGIRTA